MTDASPNYEYMNDALRTWGQTLYSIDQYKRQGPNPFFTARTLTRGQKLSEGAFVYACYGMACAEPVVGRRLVEAFSQSAPVSAWRLNVLRNQYQPSFDALETLLHEAITSGKRRVAVGAFPGAYDIGRVREALQSFGWTPKKILMQDIMGLLDIAEMRQKAQPKDDPPQP